MRLSKLTRRTIHVECLLMLIACPERELESCGNCVAIEHEIKRGVDAYALKHTFDIGALHDLPYEAEEIVEATEAALTAAHGEE